MKKFLDLTKQMLQIDTKQKTVIVDIEVPEIVRNIYDKVFKYFYKELSKPEKSDVLELLINDLTKLGIKIEGETKEEKVKFLLRKCIRISGGCISDRVIEKELNLKKPLPIQDVDVFIYCLLLGQKENKREVVQKIFQDAELLEVVNVANYNFDVSSETLKIKAEDIMIDIVIKDQIFFKYGELHNSFDYFFRAFSYDGEKVFGPERAIQNIRDKKIQIQDISSPYSSLFRAYVFEDRFGFKIPEFDKKLLIAKISYFLRYNIRECYFEYLSVKKNEKNINERIQILSEIIAGKTEFMSKKPAVKFDFFEIKSKSLTPKEFFVSYIISHLRFVKKYETLYEQMIIKDLEKFYDTFIASDANKTYEHCIGLAACINNYHLFRDRLDFFVENKMYEVFSKIYRIKDFSFDMENFFTSKKIYIGNKTMDELMNEYRNIKDLFKIKEMFSSEKYMNLQTFISKLYENDFITNYTAILGYNSFLVNEIGKTKQAIVENFTVSGWKDRLTVEFFETLAVYSNELEYKIDFNPYSYFSEGEISLRCKYVDCYDICKYIEPNHLYETFSKKEGGTFVDYFEIPLKLEGNEFCFKGLKKVGRFLYLNGSRYDKFVEHLKSVGIKIDIKNKKAVSI